MIVEKDSDGNLPKFFPGDRVFVQPIKMHATVIRQLASYDGPEYWFWGNATKAPSKVYTGTEMIGIGQMHKSNAVPIFRKDDAKDIASMRS